MLYVLHFCLTFSLYSLLSSVVHIGTAVSQPLGAVMHVTGHVTGRHGPQALVTPTESEEYITPNWTRSPSPLKLRTSRDCTFQTRHARAHRSVRFIKIPGQNFSCFSEIYPEIPQGSRPQKKSLFLFG